MKVLFIRYLNLSCKFDSYNYIHAVLTDSEKQCYFQSISCNVQKINPGGLLI